MQTRHHTSLGLKAITIAAGLVLAHAHATGQTVGTMGIGNQFVVSDPAGSGQSALVTMVAGSSTTDLTNGDFATYGDLLSIWGALGFLNVGFMQVDGVGGATVSEQTMFVDELGRTVLTNVSTRAGVSSFTAILDGPSAGAIQTVSVNGGVTLSGTRITGTLTGGELQISNVRVGFGAGQVLADMSGTKAAVGSKSAVVYNSPNTVLWTFDPVADVVGPTQLKPASLLATDPVAALQADGYTVIATGVDAGGFAVWEATANTQVNNLSITTTGAQFLTDALGLLSVGRNSMNEVNNMPGKWGSINTVLTFATSLPEPSTYVCMGLGLVGIALAARHKKSMQAA